MKKTNKKILKSVSGLSLIEAAIAILMVAVSVTTIISLQSILSRGVFNAHSYISRLYVGKNLFVTADKDKWYTENSFRTQRHEDPLSTLTYKAQKVTKENFKNFPSILAETITISWKGILGKTREETLLTFRFDGRVKKS